jgi:hypothetical protein
MIGVAEGAIGDNCFEVALMVASVSRSAGRSADSQLAAEGLRRSFRPGGAITRIGNIGFGF